MKKILSVILPAISFVALAAPEVSDVNVSVDAVFRTTTVSYSLSEDAVVTFDVLTNGVSIGGANLQGVVGDVNRMVEAGSRTLVWCWPQELNGPQLPAAATVRVTAWPLDDLPDYIVCDLCTSGALSFYANAESIPGGVGDDRYKTDYLVLRRIPAKGVTWQMGSPESETGRAGNSEARHRVTFTNDYYMGIYEVTQRQYERAMGIGDVTTDTTEFPTSITNAPTYPLDGVRWVMGRSAQAGWNWVPPDKVARDGNPTFILGMLSGKTGFTFDLPTEAEWEYACRAGEGAARYDGTGDSSTLGDLAWYAANAGGAIHPVGLKKPNRWGLYDMYGNVPEWCLDWYSPEIGGESDSVVTNPVGPSVASPTLYHRVLRGGSKASGADSLRSAARVGCNFQTKGVNGLRVVALNVSLAE